MVLRTPRFSSCERVGPRGEGPECKGQFTVGQSRSRCSLALLCFMVGSSGSGKTIALDLGADALKMVQVFEAEYVADMARTQLLLLPADLPRQTIVNTAVCPPLPHAMCSRQAHCIPVTVSLEVTRYFAVQRRRHPCRRPPKPSATCPRWQLVRAALSWTKRAPRC